MLPNKEEVLGGKIKGYGDLLFPIFSMIPFGVPLCVIPTVQHSPGGFEVILNKS